MYNIFSDAGFGDPDEKLEIDEEGGGWDVGDDDLELPADLVCLNVSSKLIEFFCFIVHIFF